MEELKYVDFGEVIKTLKSMRDKENEEIFVALRKGWNSHRQYISLYVPKGGHVNEFLFIKSVGGKVIPWLASQTDMLAEDWVIGKMEELNEIIERL